MYISWVSIGVTQFNLSTQSNVIVWVSACLCAYVHWPLESEIASEIAIMIRRLSDGADSVQAAEQEVQGTKQVDKDGCPVESAHSSAWKSKFSPRKSSSSGEGEMLLTHLTHFPCPQFKLKKERKKERAREGKITDTNTHTSWSWIGWMSNS